MDQDPVLEVEAGAQPARIRALGAWNVHGLARPGVLARLRNAARAAPKGNAAWDLSGALALDHIGAQWLWDTWGRVRPAALQLTPAQQDILGRVAASDRLALPQGGARRTPLARSADAWAALIAHGRDFVILIGQLVIDLLRFLRAPLRGPWREFSAHVYHIGYQALGITALVGFLIGIVLSYLSAQQLAAFGADIFLVDILGMAIVRELGPLLAAILVAGRSGSAITAQLGVMRVTEELDAMLVMGMPHGFRLILPRVLALALAMPLLVVWTDAIALLGGMVAARLELGLTFSYFLRELPDAVPIANYWIGLGKGVVFGVLIALVACHFGLRIEANTESLGRGTTLSVVTAITAVIIADAVFAIVFSGVGFY